MHTVRGYRQQPGRGLGVQLMAYISRRRTGRVSEEIPTVTRNGSEGDTVRDGQNIRKSRSTQLVY